MRQIRQSLSDLGPPRAAGVQYLLDDIYLYVAFQSSTKLPDCAADAPLLHFPALQHLVHHLRQAVAAIVVPDDVYFHGGQTQSPRTTLPVVPDVFPQKCSEIEV